MFDIDDTPDEFDITDTTDTGNTSNTTDTTDSTRSWRMCEITQDCVYGWTIEAVKKMIDGWSAVKDYVYILHNLDYKEDHKTKRDDHVHLLVRFKYPVHSSAIMARAVSIGLDSSCITENRIEKIKSWSGAVNYLTHRDETDKPYKHVYDVSCIVSNFDWELASEPAHAKKKLAITPLREKEIIDRICSGEIKEYNIGEFVSTYEQVKLNRSIVSAFKIQNTAILKEERKMEVMFITGPSRVGKDTFAREWCKQQKLDYFTTNNNEKFPFDNYRGEPVIIWSDARDDVFKPHNLHQLLDNNFQSSQHARFYDRALNCRYMIITSMKPLEAWYKLFYDKEGEDRVQLFARIKTYFVMDRDNIVCKVFNQNLRNYDTVCTIPNTYSHEEEILNSKEKRVEFVKGILGGLADAATFIKDNIDNPDYQYPDKSEIDVSFRPASPVELSDMPFTDPCFIDDRGNLIPLDGGSDD